MDQISNLVRRDKGNSSSSRTNMDVERPPRPRRHHQRQAEPGPEVNDDEPLDLEPLQFEMLAEEMHEAQLEAEATMEDAVEEQIPDFHSPFEGQPNPDVFPEAYYINLY
jgi:hypothetical protein